MLGAGARQFLVLGERTLIRILEYLRNSGGVEKPRILPAYRSHLMAVQCGLPGAPPRRHK
jgi:hypothetical protein